MNLIPMIAKELGVEIDEEFKISQQGEVLDDGALYKFNGKWFLRGEKGKNGDDWKVCINGELNQILNGYVEIVKLPFEPKDGERYWYVYWNYTLEHPCVTDISFEDSDIYYHHIYCGNCFRTEAEAEKHKYEIYEKLTGRKWEEK